MSEIGHLLRLVDLELAVRLVAAADALTPLIAEPSLREALAVHLQAVDLGALAAWVVLVAGGEIQLRNSAHYALLVGPAVVFVD